MAPEYAYFAPCIKLNVRVCLSLLAYYTQDKTVRGEKITPHGRGEEREESQWLPRSHALICFCPCSWNLLIVFVQNE